MAGNAMQILAGRGSTGEEVTAAQRRRSIGRAIASVSAADVAIVLFLVVASGGSYSLFSESIERYVWLVADVLLLIWAYRHPRRLRSMVRQNGIFMVWALLATVSAVWSLNPFISLYQGAQLILTTLMALMFGYQSRGMKLMKLLFVAIAICQALSVLTTVASPASAIGWAGEWRGSFSHKNTLGTMSAIQIVTGICLLLAGWRALFTTASTLVAVYLLLQSSSSSSALVLLATLLALPLILTYRWGPRLAGGLIGAALVTASAVAALVALTGLDIAGLVLERVGKDATLTGRTVLWQFGIDAFLDRPLLGHGFRGYWESTASTAHELRQTIGQNLWFFHNSLIEQAVAFGVIGPVLFCAGMAIAFRRSLRAHVATRSSASLWAMLVVLNIAFYSISENPVLVNHGFHQLLLVAAVVAAAPLPPEGRAA